VTTGQDSTSTEPVVGKGRPTPKRRDAEQKRKQRIKAPTDRKEATKLRRDEVRRRRRSARVALANGDLSKLPPRDAGPVRAFARDYVDARRNVGSYFLPVVFLIFAFGLSSVSAVRLAGNGVLILAVLAVIVDSRLLGRRLIREIEQRWPKEDTKGLRLYAITRALQIRRLRLPKPRVTMGTKL
jgi:Protein of unknown function (DUF3043)